VSLVYERRPAWWRHVSCVLSESSYRKYTQPSTSMAAARDHPGTNTGREKLSTMPLFFRAKQGDVT